MDFVYLHTYSGYSLLKSSLTIEKIVKNAYRTKQKSVALCDFESMTGFPEFTSWAKKGSLKPIYGTDVLLNSCTLSFFIKSEEGYRNLIKILFAKSKKDLSLDFIKSHQEGLSIVLPVQSSKLSIISINKDIDEAGKYLFELSKDLRDFSLGLPYFPENSEFIQFVRDVAIKYPYKIVAFPFLCYEKEEDAISLSILRAIEDGAKLNETSQKGNECYLSEETLTSYFTTEEIKGANDLANGLTFDFIQKRGHLLKFPTPNGESATEYLRELSLKGLNEKVNPITDEYLSRLDYELGVISKMGYSDYFLLVSDYVNYCKNNNIPVGPGRGSGPSSLVSFCLGINKPDPIKYGLMFERFLNPERQSMPDIDVDFADNRREEVMQYIRNKYGADKVAHIVTLTTIGPKASIRDAGRVFNYRDGEVDLIAKMIDSGISLRENYKANPRLAELINSDKHYLSLITMASKIEGLPRNSSLHASGIVINDEALDDVIPVKDEGYDGLVVQYEMNNLEEQGFLKMDILGLINLSIINAACQSICKSHDEIISWKNIPYDDPEAVNIIAKTKTMGLFQLESPGMNRTIRQVKITSFNDVMAVIALFRPGPMDDIPAFVAAKNFGRKPRLEDQRLEPILRETYGVIIYQEQIMSICREIAKMPFSQADLFRRAIAKKDAAKMASLKETFIKGCLDNRVERPNAESLYRRIAKFAGYGFNKAHALGYAILACQMAYLKAHYPLEFYCALLDFSDIKSATFPSLLSEIKTSGIKFSLPFINEAEASYRVVDGNIMYPLRAIKEIPGSLISDIIDERSNGGPFVDPYDFCLRMLRFGLKTEHFVKLIDAGCFDKMNSNRRSLRTTASHIISYAQMIEGDDGLGSLIDMNFPKPLLADIEPNRLEDLEGELSSLGQMVSGSPLERKKDVIASMGLLPLSEAAMHDDEQKYAAIISSVRTIVTKRGSKMAFIEAYDDVFAIKATIFEEGYNISYDSLKTGALVAITLTPDNRSEGAYIARQVKTL